MTPVQRCVCTCVPDGCPFVAVVPWTRCAPCRTHHPTGLLPGEEIVGYLYPDQAELVQ